MKKITLLAGILLCSLQSNAQALNEVKWNVLNTIVQQSVEIGYEHFIDQDQSIGAEILINDRFSYFGENKKATKFKKFNTSSIALNYNFHFGGKNNEHASGFYASPFLKYRFGDYEKYDENSTNVNKIEKVDMNSFILGVGAGYKIVRNDSFTIAPFVNIARNFSEEVISEFMGIELNAGINIGYRF
ncbi:DUF3575 domain-containing protein [Capnocytophaga sp. ARDL2]|uniref:DUF3575 domain-containing protein n=1 Tax=Capnocytophaga sp. ARDL2 TaxID=3238809 RepID=UPI003555D7B8